MSIIIYEKRDNTVQLGRNPCLFSFCTWVYY
uniref:Uncharacterized protein n=1 Tax=Anguilla anguilla TaxID=7936 RepID=A0A0E9Q0K0_ANGAN